MPQEGAVRKDEIAEPATVNIVEARDILGELVNRVSFGGERIVITKHGKPIAALVSLDDLAALRRAALVAE